jgi:ribosomal protein S18 acetylase RimI-like enzyme
MEIKYLPFDSELFGYPVGAVTWNNLFTEEKFLNSEKKNQLTYIFSENPIPFSDPRILQVDTKITFSKKISSTIAVDDIHALSSSEAKVLAEPELELLSFLALESGQYSRFKLDPRLSNQEFEKLYKIWIESSLSDGTILISESFQGMITYSLTGNIAKIGLIAVHPDYRGQGLGKKLIHAAESILFDLGIDTLLIPTQEVNQSAMALYRKMGYEVSEKVYVYHFWRESL